MTFKKNSILVTGGAGFIGSHVCKKLKELQHRVVVIDNLSRGHRKTVEKILKLPLYVGNISDQKMVSAIIEEHNIELVMHFSAYAYVGESSLDPLLYYKNNVMESIQFLDTLLQNKVNKIIFSSSCATYGIPEQVPIAEDSIQSPISPYGESKLILEKLLQNLAETGQMSSLLFRYFNAAGSDPDCEIGECHDPETHLIPLALLSAMGRKSALSIFGDDYATPDGTCIRDYLHVNDIADAHILGIDKLKENECQAYNLGSGKGHSVKEIIASIERVTGLRVPIIQCSKRKGDPPILIATAAKAQHDLSWKIKHPSIDEIVLHTWNWLKKNDCDANKLT